MKIVSVAAFSALLALPLPLVAQASDVGAAADIEAIQEQARRFSAAYIAGDIESLVAFYTADGVAAPGGTDFIRGHDDLRRLWRLPEGRSILRHASLPEEIRVEGDRAYDWGYYEGQAVQDGNPLQPFRGKYVIIWQRGTDGVWRMAVDMWNSLPAPDDGGG